MMPRFRAWRRAHMADRSKGARLGLRRWPPAVCPVRCWIRRPWCWWTVGSTPTSLGRVRVGRRVIEKVSAGDPKKASIKRHFLISEGFIPLSSLTHVPHTIQPYRTLRISHQGHVPLLRCPSPACQFQSHCYLSDRFWHQMPRPRWTLYLRLAIASLTACWAFALAGLEPV